MRLAIWLAIGGILSAIGAGCTPRDAGESPARTARPATSHPDLAPSPSELAQGTYTGIPGLPDSVTLVDGRWEGAPLVAGGAAAPALQLVPSFRLLGDLDQDGDEEAVVLLAQSSGGSGDILYLAVVDRRGGSIRQIAAAPLGDRVQVRRARIEGPKVVLDVVQAGPADAMCCPGELAERNWTLEGETLKEGASTPAGRLSRSVLEDTEWVLRSWAWNESAPAAPEVTFEVEGDRISGRSGCNRFFGTLTAGEMAGDLKVGPLNSTRMACPESAMAIESRFLEQMGGIEKFGFLATRLALTYKQKDGAIGTMLFEGRPPVRPDR
jgi:heat shock protein HslJ